MYSCTPELPSQHNTSNELTNFTAHKGIVTGIVEINGDVAVEFRVWNINACMTTIDIGVFRWKGRGGGVKVGEFPLFEGKKGREYG